MQTHHVKSLTDAIRAANRRRVVWNGGGQDENQAPDIDGEDQTSQEDPCPQWVGPSAELLTM